MKKLFLIFFIAVPAMASGGSKYSFKDPLVNDEFENVYHDISSVLKGDVRISSVTITSATFSSSMKFGSTELIKVMQIVSTTSVANFSTTSSAFVNTNLAGSITPKSTSSRILVIVSSNLRIGGAGVTAYATIVRGSTNLYGSNGSCKNRAASATGVLDIPCSMVVLDSPSSASQTTYIVQIKNSDGTTAAEWPSESTTLTQTMIMVELL